MMSFENGEDAGSSGIGIRPNGEEDFHEGSRGELLFRAKKPPPAANIVRRRNFAAFDALRAQASAFGFREVSRFLGLSARGFKTPCPNTDAQTGLCSCSASERWRMIPKKHGFIFWSEL